MARIEIAPEVLEDFDRSIEHMLRHGADDAPGRIAEPVNAIGVLSTSPMIGRPVRGGKRELVIGRGSRGYVALYRYVSVLDAVVVLAIRNQREAGFRRGR